MNNRKMNNGHMNCEYRMRGLFKTAVIAGTGLAIGKYLGKCVAQALDTGSDIILKELASNGNRYAIMCCERLNISYDIENDSKIAENKIIGFRVE